MDVVIVIAVVAAALLLTELLLPTGGAPPVSLGLIPATGNAALPLSAQALAVLAQSSALAVSLEPAGGSPTGQPTTVLFAAPLLRV